MLKKPGSGRQCCEPWPQVARLSWGILFASPLRSVYYDDPDVEGTCVYKRVCALALKSISTVPPPFPQSSQALVTDIRTALRGRNDCILHIALPQREMMERVYHKCFPGERAFGFTSKAGTIDNFKERRSFEEGASAYGLQLKK